MDPGASWFSVCWWVIQSQVVFFHLTEFRWRVGCSLTVILGLLVSCYELIRQDLIKKTHMLISGFMLLIFLGIGILVDWLIIMHQNVRHAMQLLGTGGITSVKTSLGGGLSTSFPPLRIKPPCWQYHLRLTFLTLRCLTGLKMNLAAIPFLGFLILLQYIICGKGREDHDSEVSQNISMTEIKNAPMSAREQRRQEEEGKKHVSDNLLEIAKNRRLASWFGVGPNS